MHIGEAIRITRLRQRRTQESVALEVGFNAGNLSRLELGLQSVGLDRFMKLAEVLGVNPSDLFLMIEASATDDGVHLQETEAAYAPEIQSLNRAYVVLDADHRAMVMRLVQDLAKATRAAK